MNPKLKWTLIGLGVVVVGAQAIRPDRTNPPYVASESITAHVDVPADVLSMIESSCLDCHSHRTEWPWYSNIAPMSWLVAYHADHGRDYVDFDAWGSYSPYEQQDAFEEIAEVVSSGEMPLSVYLPLHPEAKLTDTQRARFAAWARLERDRVRGSIGDGDHEEHDHDDHDHDDH